MSNAGPGLAPNKEATSGKVQSTGHKKIFSAGGVKGFQDKAPLLKPGQTSAGTGGATNGNRPIRDLMRGPGNQYTRPVNG